MNKIDQCSTSAYGAMTPIPEDVDLLVAGFSCVDFSGLNNFKRTLEQRGESGDTLRAILAYAEKYRPRMIVLENVFTAPWEKIKDAWINLGYYCSWARFDTKNHYIPHTRQRGYMICVDKKRLSNGNIKMDEWQAVVDATRRKVSCPVEAFILDEDDPRVRRGREEMARGLRGDDRKDRVVDWTKCQGRHQDYRSLFHLGIKRPMTDWVDGGTCKLPDYCWNDWGKVQVERIWDTLEIGLLRNARRGFDMQYKT
jgi:site-specific DNA-cytosine methylase